VSYHIDVMPTPWNKWNTDFGSTRSHRRIIGKVLGLLQQNGQVENGSSYILSSSELTQRIPWTDVSTCVVPRTLSSYGDRTFTAAGPRLWNSLPVQLRNPDITYGLFRRQLKGHFLEAWTRRSVTSDMRRHGKTLTYLLTVNRYFW